VRARPPRARAGGEAWLGWACWTAMRCRAGPGRAGAGRDPGRRGRMRRTVLSRTRRRSRASRRSLSRSGARAGGCSTGGSWAGQRTGEVSGHRALLTRCRSTWRRITRAGKEPRGHSSGQRRRTSMSVPSLSSVLPVAFDRRCCRSCRCRRCHRGRRLLDGNRRATIRQSPSDPLPATSGAGPAIRHRARDRWGIVFDGAAELPYVQVMSVSNLPWRADQQPSSAAGCSR
jgi:hypothetical protein